MKRTKKGTRLLCLFLLIMMVLSLVPLIPKEARAEATDISETHSTGFFPATYDPSSLRYIWTFMTGTSIKETLNRIYRGARYDISADNTVYTFQDYTVMYVDGKRVVCANPLVISGSSYSDRISIEAELVDKENQQDFFSRIIRYKYPAPVYEEALAYAATIGEGIPAEDWLYYSCKRAFFAGMFCYSANNNRIQDILDLYYQERPDAPVVTVQDFKDPLTGLLFSWHYSIDMYANSANGGWRDPTVFKPNFYDLQQVLTWMIGKVTSGEIVIHNAGMDVYYNPQIPNDDGLYSNFQVLHSFRGWPEVKPNGEMGIQKVSTKPAVTGDNSYYDLAGTTYTLYKDSALNEEAAVFTIDSNGQSNIVTDLPAGTYKLKETKAGKGYVLDETVYDVTISAGEKTTFQAKDEPKTGSLYVYKRSGDPDMTDGNEAYQLTGAEYGVFTSQEDAENVRNVIRVVTIGEDNRSQTLKDLAFGKYYVKETKAPSSGGYEIDPEIYPVELTTENSSAGIPVRVTSTDQPIPGIVKLKKVSSDPELTQDNSCYSLKGAKYTVYKTKKNGVLSGEVGVLTILDEQGNSNSLKVAAGNYYAKETKSPKGYYEDQTIHELTVSPGETGTFTAMERPKDDPVGVLLQKIDKVTGEPVAAPGASLALAEFTVKFYSGEYTDGVDPASLGKIPTRSWVLRTDSKGRVSLRRANRTFTYNGTTYPYKVSGDELYINELDIPILPLGTITIQETKAPTGYELDPTLHVRKINGADVPDNVESSQYLLEGEEKIFENPILAKLQVVKTSSDPEMTDGNDAYSPKGIKYGLYSSEADAQNNQNQLYEFTLDEDGVSEVKEELYPGCYYIKETYNPDTSGLVSGNEVIPIDTKGEYIADVNKVYVTNQPKFWVIPEVLVQKVDQATGEAKAQTDAVLYNAEFELCYYRGKFEDGEEPSGDPTRIWTLSTDEDGKATLNSATGDPFYYNSKGEKVLPLGFYTIRETKASEGYKLSSKIWKKNVQSGKTSAEKENVYFENEMTEEEKIFREPVILNRFFIRKLINPNDGHSEVMEPEAGAEFTAIAKKYIDQNGSFEDALAQAGSFGPNEMTVIVTDENGEATSGDLAYGNYVIRQTGGKQEVELLNKEISFTVHQETDPIVHYNIENAERTYFLKLVKVDSATGERITLTGASFRIKDKSTNELVKMNVGGLLYDTFRTTASTLEALPEGTFYAYGQDLGTTMTPLRLKAGNYEIIEVENPEGYKILDEPIPITVTEEKVTGETVAGDEYIEVTAENKPQYGELTLHKTGEQLTGWIQEEIPVEQQEEGTVQVLEREIPRANEALILKRSWIVTEKVETLVEASPPIIDEETGEVITPAEEEIQKSTKDVEHNETETVYTDEAGHFKKELSEQGMYTITDKDGNEVARLTLEEGETGVIAADLPATVLTEEERVPGEIVSRTYTVNRPVFASRYLAGAEYGLQAKHEIRSYDGVTVFYEKNDRLLFAQKDIVIGGETLYKKNDVISVPVLPEEIRTNKEYVNETVITEGEPLVISKIPLGDYALIENKAPAGFFKDETSRDYHFTPQEKTILVDLKETPQMENGRQEIAAYILKEMEGEKDFSHMVIGLYTKEEVGGLLKDQLVAVGHPEKNGAFLVPDLPKGDYYFKELSTKDGYILNENEFSLSLTPDEGAIDDKVEKVKEPLINEQKTRTVTIVKTDSLTGKPLANVAFKLYRIMPEGGEEPILGTDGEEQVFLSGGDGKVVLEDLIYGNYVLKEIRTADGYVESQTNIKIAVSDDSLDSAIMKNEASRLLISKIDKNTGKRVQGAILQLLDSTGNPVYIDVNHFVTTQEKGQPAKWTTTDEDFIIYGVSVNEEYQIEEIQPAEGYDQTERVKITVENVVGGQLKEVVNVPYVPVISTEAFTGKGLKQTHAISKMQIVDVVSYEDLIPGRKYKAVAVLVLTEEETVLSKGSRIFTPSARKGEIGVDLGSVDFRTLEGQTYVVYEKIVDLTTKEVVAKHEEKDDPKQQIEVRNPEIKTSASFADGFKEAEPISCVVVRDVVSFSGLIQGEGYETKGKLVDKLNPEKVIAESSATFLAKEESGTVNVVFTFDASELQGKKLVVFEYLFYGDELIGQHENPEDEDQTIEITEPKVGTTAGFTDGLKQADPIKDLQIKDIVSFENLIVGHTYHLSGKLVEKDDPSKVITTVDMTFTPETSSGTTEMIFAFDASEFQGKKLVVFEYLFYGDKLIGQHENPEDEDQTVEITEPKVQTKAKANGGNEVLEGKELTIIDTVNYEGLVIGHTYMVKGVLMDKATGKPILVNGKEVTAEQTFEATSESGDIEMTFQFDGTGLSGRELVVFEKLFSAEGDLIAAHEEIEDREQTVKIVKPKEPRYPSTGEKPVKPAFQLLLSAGILFGMILLAEKKKELKKQEQAKTPHGK